VTFVGGFLLYAGLLVAAASVSSLLKPIRFLGIRTRRRAALVLGLAFGLFTAGVYLPCPATHLAAVRSHLDEFQPVYQFGEVHSVLIHAPVAHVWTAMYEVTPEEITFFRTLMWLRFFSPPAPHRPMLEGFLRGSFLLLANDPPRELVFGKTGDGRHHSASTAAEFQAFPSPQIRIAVNFRLREVGAARCLLTTETRVYAAGAEQLHGFAAYWRMIYPGSSLIRHMWLRAIRLRAEASTPESM
jgi:hypothetical protein